jgi:hypothetical protein
MHPTPSQILSWPLGLSVTDRLVAPALVERHTLFGRPLRRMAPRFVDPVSHAGAGLSRRQPGAAERKSFVE